MTPPAPVITTELARVLYAREGDAGNTVGWLSRKLKVGRQTVGHWVHGREKVPRRRQAQIRLHLEEPTLALFDRRGVARRLDGTYQPTREEERSAR